MSEEDIPHTVETVLDRDGTEEVTSEYEDVIDTLIPLAHNRSTPVPIRHILVYVEDDNPNTVVFSFTIDTNDNLFEDGLYGFEIAIRDEVADSFGDKDVSETIAEERSLALDQFSRLTRTAQETIWSDVVNLGEDGD